MQLTSALMFTACLIFSSNVFSKTLQNDLIKAAFERTTHSVRYDGRYIKLDYPNGDVPDDIGVCSDVIIRSYRAIGIDLQKLIHEDMLENFNHYPSTKIWRLTRPDKNIDHRRVPNLQVFFSRFGDVLSITNDNKNYQAGELVTWILPGNLPHIGIVTDQINPASGNPMIIHNIGRGPKLEDMLFDYPITGHYRYIPVSNLSLETKNIRNSP